MVKFDLSYFATFAFEGIRSHTIARMDVLFIVYICVHKWYFMYVIDWSIMMVICGMGLSCLSLLENSISFVVYKHACRTNTRTHCARIVKVCFIFSFLISHSWFSICLYAFMAKTMAILNSNNRRRSRRKQKTRLLYWFCNLEDNNVCCRNGVPSLQWIWFVDNRKRATMEWECIEW